MLLKLLCCLAFISKINALSVQKKYNKFRNIDDIIYIVNNVDTVDIHNIDTGKNDNIINKNTENIENISCNGYKLIYTNATIVSHSILYTVNEISNTIISKNRKQSNLTFHGEVKLEYSILPSCSYTCNMLVIENQNTSKFVQNYFDNLYRVGTSLHVYCNTTMCKHNKLLCENPYYKDEL